MIKLAAKYTVARMLERRDFRERFDSGVPISVHEFLYRWRRPTTRSRSPRTSSWAGPTSSST